MEKAGGLDVGFQAEGLTGGVLLGVKGQGGVGFYDWQTGGLVRRIEVDPKEVCSVLCVRGNLINGNRSTGLKMANWFRLLAKTRFMFYDFHERITFPLSNLGRWRMTVLRLLLKSLLISTRGK